MYIIYFQGVIILTWKPKHLTETITLFGSNIKKYRELRGLSQRDLSDKLILLGVNLYHSDISRIECNTLFIRDFEQKAICKVLNISYEQLFENTDKYFD